MKKPEPAPHLSFASRLERIAVDAEYYGLAVPANISGALGTRGPVPVSARINGGTPFLVSLYPVGGGRHSLRVKAAVRREAGITGGDRVRVEITVVDRAAFSIPPDVERTLRAAGVLAQFKALPPGKRNYTLRWIEQAARPETRQKRIDEAVEMARAKPLASQSESAKPGKAADRR